MLNMQLIQKIHVNKDVGEGKEIFKKESIHLHPWIFTWVQFLAKIKGYISMEEGVMHSNSASLYLFTHKCNW